MCEHTKAKIEVSQGRERGIGPRQIARAFINCPARKVDIETFAHENPDNNSVSRKNISTLLAASLPFIADPFTALHAASTALSTIRISLFSLAKSSFAVM